MTDFHGLNTPESGSSDWHIPLNENFEKIDRGIEIRDESDNLNQYEAKEGSKFLATDTGQIYLGNGEEWEELGSVSSNGAATDKTGVLVATSPDDINTQLRNLPEYGGTVRLLPGRYDDDDWTTPITIPNNNGKAKLFTIDMRGSYISLSDFKPDSAYIRREVSEYHPIRLQLYGPSFWTVNKMSSAPAAVELFDISISNIWLPMLEGPFEYGVIKRAGFASGHFNRIFLQGWNLKSGFKIGDTRDGQSSDRSFYYGQLGHISDYGVRVEKGKWNEIWAQVEDTSGDGKGYGCYAVPNDAQENTLNRYKIQEEGADIPFYLMNPRSQIDLVGGITNRAWARSHHVIPPDQVSDAKFHSQMYNWATDRRHEFDIGGSTGLTEIKPYGMLQLQADMVPGANTYVQTVANATNNKGKYARIWGKIYPSSTSNAIHRFGIWADNNNHVMAEADTTAGNWRLVVTADGDRRATEDTTIPIESGDGVFISVCNRKSRQSLSIYQNQSENAADAAATVDTTGFGFTDMRAETVSKGNANSSRKLNIEMFGYECDR